MPTTQSEGVFHQAPTEEVHIDWAMDLGPDGEVAVNANGSHFHQAPILSLLTGGNGKPTLDVRLPPDFNGTVYVRKGGNVRYQMLDGEDGA